MFMMTPFGENSMNLAKRKRSDHLGQLWSSWFSDGLLAPVAMLDNFASNFRVDIQESKEAFLIEADLPGINKEAIDVSYEDNYLTIAAQRKDSTPEGQDNYVHRERYSGEYRRSFYIQGVERNKIDAAFSDGVLKINIPKKDSTSASRRIAVN